MSPVSATPVEVLIIDPPPFAIMWGAACLIISIVPRVLIWNARSQTAASIWSSSLRSEEHTSELQSLMRISYAVFCLKKQKYNKTTKLSDEKHTNHQKPHNI